MVKIMFKNKKLYLFYFFLAFSFFGNASSKHVVIKIRGFNPSKVLKDIVRWFCSFNFDTRPTISLVRPKKLGSPILGADYYKCFGHHRSMNRKSQILTAISLASTIGEKIKKEKNIDKISFFGLSLGGSIASYLVDCLIMAKYGKCNDYAVAKEFKLCNLKTKQGIKNFATWTTKNQLVINSIGTPISIELQRIVNSKSYQEMIWQHNHFFDKADTAARIDPCLPSEYVYLPGFFPTYFDTTQNKKLKQFFIPVGTKQVEKFLFNNNVKKKELKINHFRLMILCRLPGIVEKMTNQAEKIDSEIFKVDFYGNSENFLKVSPIKIPKSRIAKLYRKILPVPKIIIQSCAILGFGKITKSFLR